MASLILLQGEKHSQSAALNCAPRSHGPLSNANRNRSLTSATPRIAALT